MFPNTNFIKSNFAILLLLVVCIVALSGYECITSENIEAVMSLLALGICIAFTFAKSIYNCCTENNVAKSIGFFLLICGFVLGYLQLLHFALFIVSLACVVFFCGIKAMLACVLPFAIWIIGVFNYSHIHIMVSYPMRVLETIISEGILSLIGYDVFALSTSIYVNGKEIVITTACSGIEHLWTLFLLAWISCIVMFKKLYMRAIYFLCIIPLFIVCNAYRVVLSVVGMKFWGEKVLEGNAHFALGLFAIISTMVLFVIVGLLLRKLENGENTNDA